MKSGRQLLSKRRLLLWRCQTFDKRTRWRVRSSAARTFSLICSNVQFVLLSQFQLYWHYD